MRTMSRRYTTTRAMAADREHDLALDLAEGHEVEAGEVLPLGQTPHELAHLADRGIRQIRHAVKMHEEDAAPALHHAPGGHRRVDAPRDERGHRPARAHGQAARARAPVGIDEGFVRQHLHVNLQGGVVEVHPRLGAPALNVGAQLAVELGRGHGKGLEGPARRDAERREGLPLDHVVHRSGERRPATSPCARRARCWRCRTRDRAARAPPRASGDRPGRARCAREADARERGRDRPPPARDSPGAGGERAGGCRA